MGISTETNPIGRRETQVSSFGFFHRGKWPFPPDPPGRMSHGFTGEAPFSGSPPFFPAYTPYPGRAPAFTAPPRRFLPRPLPHGPWPPGPRRRVSSPRELFSAFFHVAFQGSPLASFTKCPLLGRGFRLGRWARRDFVRCGRFEVVQVMNTGMPFPFFSFTRFLMEPPFLP